MIKLADLQRFIVKHYSLEELRTLCFDLNILYDDLGGEGINTKASELLLVLGQQHELHDLIAVLQRTRPILLAQAGLEIDANTLEKLYLDLPSFEKQTKSRSQKLLEQVRLTQWIALILLPSIGIAILLYLTWQSSTPERMSGDFRIAVAGFAVKGNQTSDIQNLGNDLSSGAYQNIEEAFSELNLDFPVTIWGPDKVGDVTGDTSIERAESAANIANKIEADLIIYGLIDATHPIWTVTPEFYITDENLFDAQELTGQHEVGTPFTVIGQGSVVTRIEVSNQLTMRTKLLSQITIGLSYYATHNFEDALVYFQVSEQDESWNSIGGKEVLYILIGNAAGKSGQLNLAETAYLQALDIDLDYSRAYAGLAGIYYLQALEPFAQSKEPTDTDIDLISFSIKTFQKAINASHQPPLADIPTKVHFGLGQCYFMQVYSGHAESFNPAIEEFQAVIADYGDGTNPRIRLLAAEAHGRLGLIYALLENPVLAVDEYQTAISLLDDYPERQQLYQERARELRESLSPVQPTVNVSDET